MVALEHLLLGFGGIGGTGLGLSISYNILKNHGGELIFDSEPGRGTSATISLPPFRLEKKDPEEENQ